MKKGTVDHVILSYAQMVVNQIEGLKKSNRNDVDDYIKRIEQDKNEGNNLSEKQNNDFQILIDSLKKASESYSIDIKHLNICDILEKLSKLNKTLNNEERAAFQLCIEFLLKNDWDRQMNKK